MPCGVRAAQGKVPATGLASSEVMSNARSRRFPVWHRRRAGMIVMSRRFRTVSAMVGGELKLGRARPFFYSRVARSWRQACSQRRQACSQTRQCSCIWACRPHSSPQLLQMATQASSSGLATLMS